MLGVDSGALDHGPLKRAQQVGGVHGQQRPPTPAQRRPRRLNDVDCPQRVSLIQYGCLEPLAGASPVSWRGAADVVYHAVSEERRQGSYLRSDGGSQRDGD